MSTYDLKITNGTLIDGTGRERYRGAVGVRDGTIVDVGACEGTAKRVFDAEGAIVTPGFTDIHTHYDGQVSWDEELAPSSLHGVTTCVLGSCGVGFAPVRPADRQRLIELMEGVEDIPGSALAEGLTWAWETFPEYMDAIADMPHAIDIGVQVPHDAVRVYAMGERAVADATATEDDIRMMRTIVREALKAGAVGFSTGRSDNHKSVRGEATPASEASERELVGIAGAFEGIDHGVLQAVSDFNCLEDDNFEEEFDLIERMVAASSGHPLSMSLMQRDQAPDQWKRILARAEAAQQRGLNIRVQVAPRAIGVMLGLSATFHPFMGFPSYKPLAHLPLAERVARLRDPVLKARLLTEKSDKLAGDGSPIPPLADKLLANLDKVAMRLYRLGEEPNYEPAMDTCLYAESCREHKGVLETVYDALLEQQGHALLYFPLYNYTELNLNNVATMLNHPLALSGLSDGGAHVATVCDASFPTFLLMHWARDRATGRIPLERVVQMQARDTARFVGFSDRGTIAPGQKADINVIDFDRLKLLPPRMQADLPAGGNRLMQRAHGYRATFVSGAAILEDDQLTGARPGTLVRSGR